MDYGPSNNLSHESVDDFSPAEFTMADLNPERDNRDLGNRIISSAVNTIDDIGDSKDTIKSMDASSDTAEDNLEANESTPLGQIAVIDSAPEIQATADVEQVFYPQGEHISRETQKAVERLIDNFSQKDQPLGKTYNEIIAARAAYQSKIAARSINE